ncbi:MAG: type II secretion system GspH family protein [Desulfobacteraceae bacterium]|nr:type II secretion system GspH family protein [Desulfobacteraceae bacterium]
MTSNFKKRPWNSGFTLIEMVVVLLIIAITVALVFPRIGSSWRRIEDSDFLQEFSETIRRARLVAISSGRPAVFRLNGSERVYDIANPPRKPIPLNVEVFSDHLEKDRRTGDFLMTFYPDGSLVGDDIDVVFDHQRVFRVFIHPLFGSVRVVRLEKR